MLRLQPKVVAVVAIADNGDVAKRVFTFERQVDAGLVEWASSFLNERLSGLGIGSRMIATRLEDPELGERERGFLAEIRDAIGELAEASPQELYMEGTARLLSDTHAGDIPHADGVVRALEGRVSVLSVLRSALRERSVFLCIGEENPEPALRSVSMVSASYGLGYRNLGAVGVVGPLRMDYATAIDSVRDAAGELCRFFAHGVRGLRPVPRDHYEVLGVDRGADEARSRRRSGGSRASCTPTSTPPTRERRRSSRRPRRPTRSSPTPSGAAPTTPSATTACARAASTREPRSGGIQDIFDAFFGRGGSPFEDLFGGGAARGPAAGGDVAVRVEIDLADVLEGITEEVAFQAVVRCDHCHGNGAEPGTPIRTCETCGGAGQVRQATRTPFGQMVRAAACPTCGGAGQDPRDAVRGLRGRRRPLAAQDLRGRGPGGHRERPADPDRRRRALR